MKKVKKVIVVIVFAMASFFLMLGQCEEFLLIPSTINWVACCVILFDEIGFGKG